MFCIEKNLNFVTAFKVGSKQVLILAKVTMGDPKAALLKELLKHLGQPELLIAPLCANR